MIPFRGYETYYRAIGDPRGQSRKLPVLAVHGDPGISHETLSPLERITEPGRPLVFYDQLGCGRSDRPNSPDLWSVELFLQELATVRKELDLEGVHLLGHSWGGMLALNYAASGPEGIESLTLIGTPTSAEAIRRRRHEVYKELPEGAEKAIRSAEERRDFEDPAYRKAIWHLYLRYVCRMDPWPEWLSRAESEMNAEVNVAMWTGPLSDYDAVPLLPRIRVPTLVVAGRYDGMAGGQEQDLREGIARSELVLAGESAHYTFAEEPELFFPALETFLADTERGLAR